MPFSLFAIPGSVDARPKDDMPMPSFASVLFLAERNPAIFCAIFSFAGPRADRRELLLVRWPEP